MLIWQLSLSIYWRRFIFQWKSTSSIETWENWVMYCLTAVVVGLLYSFNPTQNANMKVGKTFHGASYICTACDFAPSILSLALNRNNLPVRVLVCVHAVKGFMLKSQGHIWYADNTNNENMQITVMMNLNTDMNHWWYWNILMIQAFYHTTKISIGMSTVKYIMTAGHFVDIFLESTLETTFTARLYVGIIARIILYHSHIGVYVYWVYFLHNVMSKVNYVDFIIHHWFYSPLFFPICIWYMQCTYFLTSTLYIKSRLCWFYYLLYIIHYSSRYTYDICNISVS